MSAPARIPFSVVDEAVHLLDTEVEPWSVQVEIRVAGRLDGGRLSAALRQALRAHPMALARKVPSRPSLHRDEWEITAEPDLDPLRVLHCPDDATLGRTRHALQSIAVPLVESPPVRMLLAHHDGGDVLMLNANHAAMDGYGALRLLQSVGRAYAGEHDPAPPPSREARDVLASLAEAGVRTRVRRHLALAEKLRDVVAPPARLAPDGSSGRPGYGFVHVALPRPETEAFVHVRHHGTVNDVLLAALHLAVDSWNAEHAKRCRRISVLVPANLRPPDWRHDVVGNFSLPARISTTPASRRSGRAVLQRTAAQTARKKRTGIGTALMEVLRCSPRLPLWAKQLMVMTMPLTRHRLVDTAMLSNLGILGDPPSFGPEAGPTTEVWFSPPTRMPLGLTVGAVTVDGRLHLAFRHSYRLFDTHAARRFADHYLAELKAVIEGVNRPYGSAGQ